MESVQAGNRRKTSALKKFLTKKALSFGFYKLVELLEKRTKKTRELATGSLPTQEPVWFKNSYELGFPAADFRSVQYKKNGKREQAEVIVNFLSLGGANSPLPMSYQEHILQRLSKKDRAVSEFLDIFSHRLVSLFYRSIKQYRPGGSSPYPEEDKIGGYQLALAGLGDPTLQKRMAISDCVALGYSGLLSSNRGSCSGLEQLLKRFFQVPVRIQPFTGGWSSIPTDQQTRLGGTGTNRTLGTDFCLGNRAWIVQNRFLIDLGPLNNERYQGFLQGGCDHNALMDMVRLNLGLEYEFSVRIYLSPEEAPPVILSSSNGSKLGRNFWLKTETADGKTSPDFPAPCAQLTPND